MNKAELINAIAAESGLSKADSKLSQYPKELKEPVLIHQRNNLSLSRQRKLLSLKQVQNCLKLLNKLYS